MEILKIPLQRISSLVGSQGEVKRHVEAECRVQLHVSPEGEVEIDGDEADIYFAREVVQAIGRGFEPSIALKLLHEDYQLYVVDLKEYTHSENSIHRIKGRIIGEEGKIKHEIEQATDSYLSIYGNTVCILAKLDSMEYAKEAISRLIHGAQHIGVLQYLSGVRRRLMSERLGVVLK